MSQIKLRVSGVERLIIQKDFTIELSKLSVTDVEELLGKYCEDYVAYQALQTKIVSDLSDRRTQANSETSAFQSVCDRTSNAGQPRSPHGYGLYDKKLGLLRRRDGILKDVARLRGEIMKVEDDIYDWICKQFRILLQVKNNDPEGAMDLHQGQRAHSQQWLPWTTERDSKKAEVKFLQETLPDVVSKIASATDEIQKSREGR